jgi:Pyruvate/2-oxoacid:ferredoxin oxidoreductase gamma subunit
MSKGLDLPPDAWEKAIVASVKEKFRDLNLKAFAAGRDAVC